MAAPAHQYQADRARHRGRGNKIPAISGRLKELKVVKLGLPGTERGDAVGVVIRVEVGQGVIHILVDLVVP